MPKESADLQLSRSTIEKLGYYVYLLVDPRNDKVFYVGKGCGNRINQHLLGALDMRTIETKKILTIRAIEAAGLEVELIILRHQLTEREAFEVESAAIDLLEKSNLTNIVGGHDSEDRGKMLLRDIKIKYEAEQANIAEPVLLININKLYSRTMTGKELYEATRKHWKVSLKRATKAQVVCSVFRGIVREVYSINCWLPSPSQEQPGRYFFEGSIANNEIRKKYLNKSVVAYHKQGAQNPIKYVNCQ